MKKINFLVLFVAAFLLFSCGGEANKADSNQQADHQTSTTPAKESGPIKGQAYVDDGVSAKNAFQVAGSLDDFSTLAAAVMAAGVENALSNNGPLTVFAPLNSAFDKLPEGTVETLLKPENKAKLAFILINHVAPSNYDIPTLKKNAKKGRKLYMASGEYLEVKQEGDDIYVGGTKIIKSVKVSNGWIHVVDDVLVPSSK